MRLSRLVSLNATTRRIVFATLLAMSGIQSQVVPAPQAQAAAIATRERRIALDGAANFRDIGGYATTDGKRVRWGQVYRSGELSRLTAADYEKLSKLGLAAVCDFRRDNERAAAPTNWQAGAPPAILNLPGDQASRAGVAPRGAGSGSGAPPALSPMLMESYPTYPTTLAASYRAVIQQIMAGNGAVLYHCTAGKDRTGTFTAMLLTMLGVPKATVMEDYLLTNQYVATPARVDAMVARGATREGAIANIGVDRAYLDVMFAAIDKDYGSFDAYRREALKVSDADLAVLRAKLLE